MTNNDQPLYERLRINSEPMNLDDMGVPKEARATFYSAMGGWIENDAHGFYLPPDAGDGHCNPEAFVETIALRLSALGHAYNGKATQSPIEDMMLGALLWVHCDWAGFPHFDYTSGPFSEEAQGRCLVRWREGSDDGVDFNLTPQAEVAGCKVDFLLWFQMGRHVGGVAIECDGHDFHEKTKEQAARDKDRDRRVLLAGFPVMRFTGREIFRDVPACVNQVREALDPILTRVSRDGGLFR